MKKQLFILIILCLGFFSQTNHVISHEDDGTRFLDPQVEVLDLNVDGSGAGGTWVNITKEFDFVTKVQFYFLFSDATYESDLFAGSTALSNGINVYYNGRSILDHHNITRNSDFGLTTCSFEPYEDEKNPKNVLIISRLPVKQLCWGFDLQIIEDINIAFHVQDNITAITEIDTFSAVVVGYTQLLYSEFEDRIEPYFWSTHDTIMMEKLVVGEEYAICIGSNQAESEKQWINFTATESRARIHFRQASAEYTNETVKISQLFIDVYWVKTITQDEYLDRLALDIIFKDEQIDFGNLSENTIIIFLFFIVLIALGGFLFAILYKRYE